MSSTTVGNDGPPVGWQRATRRTRAEPAEPVEVLDDRDAPVRRVRPAVVAGAAAVAIAVAAVAVFQANAGNSWRPPFFFDEMWRVDMIRSDHPIQRMLTNDAPVPLGWLGVMRAVTAPIPYHPVVFRAVSVVWFLAGIGVLSVLFLRVLQRPARFPDRFRLRAHPLPAPLMAAPIGVALAAFLPLVIIYAQWFNNYTFEILYVALLVLATEELDRTPRVAFPAFCVLVGLAPMFVLGGLFVVPGVVLAAGWWAFRSAAELRRRRLLGIAAGCAVAAVSAAALYVKIYKPVGSKPTITSYWIDYGAALGGGQSLVDLLYHSFTQLSAGMIGDRLYFAGGWERWLAYLVLAVSVGVGATVVGRRWPWLLAVIGSAWLLTIVASAGIHWPMTIERVNLCWQILFYAMAGVGLARAVLWCTGRFWYVGIALLALGFVALWFPPYDVGIDVFDRNLTYDLQLVADSPAPHNLVFQYHQLAQFYADNELINTGHGERTFDVRWEGQQQPDDPLLRPLDPVIRDANLASGDMVWCVIPGEVGDKAPLDCRIDDRSKLEPVTDTQGINARVVGYRVR